jgi:hypothetical protein
MKRYLAIAAIAFFAAEAVHAQAVDPDEKAVSSDEKAVSSDEKALSSDEKALSSDEKALSSDEMAANQQAANSAPATAPPGWRAYNRSAELKQEGKREIVHLDARPREGVVWREGSDFKDGTIEVDLRGKNVTAHSMLGVAFRGVDDTHFDAVFFRPFNFKVEFPLRAQHAVQYISMPDFTWLKLRKTTPGKYENAISSPAPDPSGWFRARVVVEGQAVNVYVNDAAKPTLTVTALSEPRGGMVGLFVGYGSEGDFADLKLTPKR